MHLRNFQENVCTTNSTTKHTYIRKVREVHILKKKSNLQQIVQEFFGIRRP